MTHDFTWLRRTRVLHGTRLWWAAGLLLTCILLAGSPAVASATTDMRGEWALVMESGSTTLEGVSFITQETNPKEEFTSASAKFLGGVMEGTFSGTIEGSKATVLVQIAASQVAPASEFKSTEITVNAGVGTLSLSGSGIFKVGSAEASGTFTATRLRTQQQIEEQEAREHREHEEAQARANIRGEWDLTLEYGVAPFKGTAIITSEANAKNEFASSAALFEGVVPGGFLGKLEGTKALIEITTQPYGEVPAGTFLSASIAVSSASNPTSMSGTGMIKSGAAEFPAILTATRVKTYAQVLEAEKAEKEKQEKEATEAAEKAAREKAEQEQKARELKESQERKAREEAEKAALVKPPPVVTITPLMPIDVGAKTLTVSGGGAVSLQLTNPGDLAEHGHLKLTLAKGAKAAGAKHTSTGTLGEASFSVAAHGTEVVKVKLSHTARAQLTRHKTLRVLVTVTTQAVGHPDVTKTFTLTLRAAKAAHGKH